MIFESKSFTHNTNLVSEKEYAAHLQLYKNYINKANEIKSTLETKDILVSANSTYSEYRALKLEETFVLDAIVLHELYFENLTLSTFNAMSNIIQDFFKDNFGSFENWEKHFIATAKSTRGWVVTGYDKASKQYMTISLDNHNNGMIAGFKPIIVLDMYEHAYWFDYLTDKVKYIENFIDSINWDVVQQRIGE